TIQGTLKDLNPQVNMLSYISKEKTSFDQIDWNQEIESSLRQMYADYKALLNLPLRADRILGLLQKGQLRVGISVSDLEQTILPSLNQTIDRVVVVILIAALLVGSSIVCTTNMKPTFLDIPLLGFAGFFVSFCLSLWLFYKMLFRPKKGDQLF
ncbi:MAG: AarF/ABC1/UbiB kinase family protein, partial [Allobaculum sp.]|nr:AarF/ABC1/UbiB kinase family protein [Allobaculum sp.]